jgi:excisionase family DNA binding protein
LLRRGLSHAEASAYIGVSTSTFNKLIAQGRMPQPRCIGTRRVWDIRALDDHFDQIDGTVTILAKPGNRASVRRCAERPQKCVYIVGFDDYVKIGRSDHFPHRLVDLQLGVPETLTIHGTIADAGSELEAQLHRRFAAHHLRGEWFRKEGSLATWIDGGCVL